MHWTSSFRKCRTPGQSLRSFQNELNADGVSQGTGKGFSGNINVDNFKGPIEFHADTLGVGGGGASGITFNYDGKTFNQCDCQDDSKGLTGIQACRCEFDCPRIEIFAPCEEGQVLGKDCFPPLQKPPQ